MRSCSLQVNPPPRDFNKVTLSPRSTGLRQQQTIGKNNWQQLCIRISVCKYFSFFFGLHFLPHSLHHSDRSRGRFVFGGSPGAVNRQWREDHTRTILQRPQVQRQGNSLGHAMQIRTHCPELRRRLPRPQK